MTLGELLTECTKVRKGKAVRVFAGCLTLFKGIPAEMSVSEWVKLHKYFDCKVLDKRTVNETFVIML